MSGTFNDEHYVRRKLHNDSQVVYPDFDAMWDRIESNLPDTSQRLLPVNENSVRRQWFRKPALIIPVAVLTVATPTFATLSYNWDNIVHPQSGIYAVLQQGLGQVIEQSDTVHGVKLTIHSAVVDDNRTVLLFSIDVPYSKPNHIPRLHMALTTAEGHQIEGNQRIRWDEDANLWRGYFEAEWTPSNEKSEVLFMVKDLQLYSSEDVEVAFDPSNDHIQHFTVGEGGMDRIELQSFDQGDKMLIASSVYFNKPEAQQWAFPRIAVFNDDSLVREAGSGAFGKPGDEGEYTGQQYYHSSDLMQKDLTYKLLYTRLEQEIAGEWKFNLQLDKQQLLSGTVRRELNIPVESRADRMVLKELVITPTQIRITADHQRHAVLPYLKHHLKVDGQKLDIGSNVYLRESPETTTFRYELPPGVQVTEQTPIMFVMEYEVVRYKDVKEPIHLSGIGEEKKTMITDVGGYPVKWTYYNQDGDLYIQSESTDPNFGGINQTYIKGGNGTIPAKQVTANFSGDGTNRAIDKYEDFEGTEADIYIYFYSVDYPDNGMRIELTK